MLFVFLYHCWSCCYCLKKLWCSFQKGLYLLCCYNNTATHPTRQPQELDPTATESVSIWKALQRARRHCRNEYELVMIGETVGKHGNSVGDNNDGSDEERARLLLGTRTTRNVHENLYFV